MNLIKRTAFLLPIPPIFFATSYVLTLFLHNINEVALNRLIIPIFLVIFFTTLLFLLSAPFFKNKLKTEVFSSFCILVFFSYGEISTLLQQLPLLEKMHLTDDRILFLLSFILLIIIFLLVKKSSKKVVRIHQFLRIVAIMAVIIPVLGITKYEFSQQTHAETQSHLALPKVEKADNLPDIYYILPEDYSSPSIFPTYFNYKDSSFTNYLMGKGFYDVSKATSNYPKSFLSLASTLNMEYLDYLSDNKNSSDQTVVNPLIENSNVLRFLKSQKYKYYQMGSWWGPTQLNKNANENFTIQKQNHLGFNGFTYLIIDSTILNPIIKKLLPMEIIGESNEDKRSIILYQFSAFPEVIKKPGPKFVFAHIIAPHGPYVFDKNCEFTTRDQTNSRTNEVNYINQVSCINMKLKTTIDTILSQSKKPPIILMQSDEGADFLGGKLNPDESWKNASSELLKTKFPILFAYYLPGVSQSSLYKTMTPVNSFRTIFNLYFGTNLSLLPDKNYIFPDTEHLYEFVDVTDKVRSK